jgi:hypothetical protein
MSRIQHILEKAEREGGVLRMRPMAEPAPDAGLAFETPRALVPESHEEIADEAVAPPLSAGRTVRGTALDPSLVAVMDPGAQPREHARALRTRVARRALHAVNVILVTSPGAARQGLTAANLRLTMAQDFSAASAYTPTCATRGAVHSSAFRARPRRCPGGPRDPGRRLIASRIGRSLLPAGQLPAHPAELLRSTAMRRTIQTLRSQFGRDHDAPSAAPLADIGISRRSSTASCWSCAGVTTKPAIQEAASTIGRASCSGSC